MYERIVRWSDRMWGEPLRRCDGELRRAVAEQDRRRWALFLTTVGIELTEADR